MSKEIQRADINAERGIVARERKVYSKEERLAIKQRFRDSASSMGSLYLPLDVQRFLTSRGYKWKFANDGPDMPTNLHNHYSMGWHDPDNEEAEFLRHALGSQGLFSAGSKGSGTVVEIPVGTELTARLLLCPIELYEIMMEAYADKVTERDKSIGRNLNFDAGSLRYGTNVSVKTGVVR